MDCLGDFLPRRSIRPSRMGEHYSEEGDRE